MSEITAKLSISLRDKDNGDIVTRTIPIPLDTNRQIDDPDLNLVVLEKALGVIRARVEDRTVQQEIIPSGVVSGASYG